MRTPKFSESQIVGTLREAGSGVPVATLLRRHGVSEAIFFQWGKGTPGPRFRTSGGSALAPRCPDTSRSRWAARRFYEASQERCGVRWLSVPATLRCGVEAATSGNLLPGEPRQRLAGAGMSREWPLHPDHQHA
ncbi:MAG: transposase [Acidobacteria bacterium]|nr:transposase [Acidobacteriota bacterium]